MAKKTKAPADLVEREVELALKRVRQRVRLMNRKFREFEADIRRRYKAELEELKAELKELAAARRRLVDALEADLEALRPLRRP
jgi:predicted ABC-type ATPase